MANLEYIVTVPATNNNPSVDQSNMLINTQSIDAIIAVDHVGFNENDGGYHTAIHFDQTSPGYVPTSPTNPPQLFTTFGTTPPNLRYYSGTQAQSADQYVIAAQGSTMLLGGIIIKWGTFTYSGGAQVVTFTSQNAFPNNLFSVQLTFNAAASSSTSILGVLSSTVSTFTVQGPLSSYGLYYFTLIGN